MSRPEFPFQLIHHPLNRSPIGTTDTNIRFLTQVMQWGQFLDHDLTFTPQKTGFNDSLIRCCGTDGRPLPEGLRHRDCAPIDLAEDDEFFSRFNRTCMEFVRSSPAARPDCSLGPRDQVKFSTLHLIRAALNSVIAFEPKMNQVTNFIDASNVYGSTEEEQDSLRLFDSGE